MSKQWIASSDMLLTSNRNFAMVNSYKNLSYIVNCKSGKILFARIDKETDERLTEDEILCMGCKYVHPLEDSLDEEDDFDEDVEAEFIPYCEKHECRCEYMDTKDCKENNNSRKFFVEFCED